MLFIYFFINKKAGDVLLSHDAPQKGTAFRREDSSESENPNKSEGAQASARVLHLRTASARYVRILVFSIALIFGNSKSFSAGKR